MQKIIQFFENPNNFLSNTLNPSSVVELELLSNGCNVISVYPEVRSTTSILAELSLLTINKRSLSTQ